MDSLSVTAVTAVTDRHACMLHQYYWECRVCACVRASAREPSDEKEETGRDGSGEVSRGQICTRPTPKQ